MNAQVFYIAVAIVSLVIIALLLVVLWRSKPKERLTPLAGLAFAFVLAGLFFGEERWLGYGLMGVGIILALIDIYLKLKNR